LSLSAAPGDYNNSNSHLKFIFGLNRIAKSNDSEPSAHIEYGSPLIGPARIWLNLGFRYSTTGSKGIDHALNVRVNDNINAGYKLVHDTEKIQKFKY
jgi:hypothetical protein